MMQCSLNVFKIVRGKYDTLYLGFLEQPRSKLQTFTSSKVPTGNTYKIMSVNLVSFVIQIANGCWCGFFFTPIEQACLNYAHKIFMWPHMHIKWISIMSYICYNHFANLSVLVCLEKSKYGHFLITQMKMTCCV